MENKDKNNFYAVPLIGGILCLITFFVPDMPSIFPGSFLTAIIFNFMIFTSFSELIFIIFGLITVISEIVCGCVMLYSAIKMGLGKTTLKEQKMKLMIFSWLVIGATLMMSITALFGMGFFMLINRYGFIGSLMTLIGIYYFQHMTKRGTISSPMVFHEGKKLEPSPIKEKAFNTDPKFCTNCGYNLKLGQLKFCPECGNQLSSE
jgi:hypothetical protein